MYAKLFLSALFLTAVVFAAPVNYSTYEPHKRIKDLDRPFHHYIDKEAGVINQIENPSYVVSHVINVGSDPYCNNAVNYVFPDACSDDDTLAESFAHGSNIAGCYEEHEYAYLSCSAYCIDENYSGGVCFEHYEYVPENSQWMHLGFCMCT